ncbi:MAG TPA: glycosyl hydrolase [Opitutaceae bacterium]|nr:glycosyl hydrolase [Opitutaceae bacterium]
MLKRTFLLTVTLTAATISMANPIDGKTAVLPAATRPITVVDYLKSISGRKVISGIHNREPNSRPSLQTDQLYRLIGKYPALWSGDFLFKDDDINSRWAMIYECKNQWDHGSIVQLMMHVAPPHQAEATVWDGGVLSHYTDAEWEDLVTDGGHLNTLWKRRLDEYSKYFRFLQQNRVQFLFRPFHEMNQGKFWWGGRPGPRGTAKLYQLTHDYLTKEKGLHNIIWVWDMQDMSRDFADYDPGRKYWDVFGFDIYANGYRKEWYDYIVPITGDRPIIIGECSVLPSASLLRDQPRWCGFMSWAELTFTENTVEEIRALYADDRVVTRDELPVFSRSAVSE